MLPITIAACKVASLRSRGRPALEFYLTRNDPRDAALMKAIAQLLAPEDILLDLDVSTKQRAFEEVGRLLDRRHGIAQTRVVESLNARERLGSTGLGQGVALPHARIKHLRQAVAAFMRLKLPIAFDAPDGKPVSDILVLLVPEHATDQHLEVLAEAAQMFCDRSFRDQVRNCVDAAGVCELFATWPGS